MLRAPGSVAPIELSALAVDFANAPHGIEIAVDALQQRDQALALRLAQAG
jgi:hypothetical protein